MKINFFPVDERKYPPGIQRIEYESPVDSRPDWCLYLPPAAPPSSVCAVVLHGFDGHAGQLYLRPNLRRHCLPEYLKRNFHVLTPNLRDNAWMNPAAAEDLEALLDFLARTLSIRTFILDSGSMGAVSNLIFAVLHPGRAAAVVARGAVPDLRDYSLHCRLHLADDPLVPAILDSIHKSYGGPPEAAPELYRRHSVLENHLRLRDIPVFLAHGARDPLMPVAQARRLAERCAAFPMFRYLEIPDGGHESPLLLTHAPFDWIGRFLP